MLKILHADDHVLVREGVALILRQLDSELELLHCGAFASALKLHKQHNDIDLVLVDLNMPDTDGTDSVQALWRTNPTTPIVVLTASGSDFDVETALEQGAAGYVRKSAAGDTLLRALRLVLDGGIYAPRTEHRRTVQNGSMANLTARQRQVLALIAQGLPNRSIADRLFVTEATIKGHVSAIFDVLAVSNRTQAVGRAQQLGLLRSA